MDSHEQTAETLLRLTPAQVADLKEGLNFFRNKSTGRDFILYKSDSRLRACRNRCKHQGGLFIRDMEDLDGRSVKCTKHNWRLDVSTMKYINPPGSFCQDELVVEMDENNGLLLLELNPPNPWDSEPRAPEELAFGEVQITYLTHACMDLKLGDKRMIFDPWLTGPAFARGWWLLHEPPSDWLERLCRADLVYISHMHSDHLSYPTLKKLARRRPDIPIYVGNTERPVFWHLAQSGVRLTNINVVPFGIWQQVDKNLRFMILMDGIHPEMDTCIIVEYKGHKILNTVDCTRPNGGRLPEKVALMMSDFAGGASGFPMTFSGGKFTEEWKAQFIKTERRKLLNYKAQLVKDLQPRVFCPFAGYFVEAHPADKYADARRCLPCELARRNRGVAVVQWGGRGLDEASRTLHQVAGNRGWEQPLGSQRQCRDCFKASQGRGRQSVFIKYWVVRKVRMRFSLCKKCVTTFLTTQSMAGRSPASSP